MVQQTSHNFNAASDTTDHQSCELLLIPGVDVDIIPSEEQGGTKLFAVSDRKLSMIPDSRVLESNKSKKLAAIEILRTF